MAADKQAGELRNAFIRQRFSRYYRDVDLPEPNRLAQREFGIITERGGMWRHLGFANQKELENFLKKQVPLHAYHSSTYYDRPDARKMNEKGWLGADLVFDLDADHLEGSENMSLQEMFASVKQEFQKLLDSYLLGDFGFDEKDILIVFSGGRGYHAHVRDRRVLELNSHERREIVDFITTPHIEIDQLVIKEIFDTKEFKGHVSRKYKYGLYPMDTPGWKGKVTHSVVDFITRTENMERGEILGELMRFKGIGDKMAAQIYKSLYQGTPGTRGIDKIRNELNLEPFSSDKVRNSFINYIVKEMSVRLGGETDEPVTSDIRRLIRLPGTLHGKTGFRVMPMNRTELDDFEPLRDAVWDGFNEQTIKIMPKADYEIKLKDEIFKIKKDGAVELPEYAALHLICQKKCDIII